MIGEKLKFFRKKKGWKQSELAEKVGLSKSQISYLEANQRKTNSETIAKIADALDISILDLYEEKQKEELSDGEEAWILLNEDLKKKGYTPEEIRKWLDVIENLRSQ